MKLQNLSFLKKFKKEVVGIVDNLNNSAIIFKKKQKKHK
jgi:hypothetical protein